MVAVVAVADTKPLARPAASRPSQGAHRDVTEPRDAGQGDDDQPDPRGIQHAVGANPSFGQERQHHEGDHQELKGVLELYVRDGAAHEAVQLGLAREEDGDHDRERRRERGVAVTQRSEQVRGEGRDLGRGAGMDSTGAPVAEQHERRDRNETSEDDPSTEVGAERAGDGQQRERPHAECRPVTLSLATFAFGAEQQSDGE
jgi:hypothetical protein